MADITNVNVGDIIRMKKVHEKNKCDLRYKCNEHDFVQYLISHESILKSHLTKYYKQLLQDFSPQKEHRKSGMLQ